MKNSILRKLIFASAVTLLTAGISIPAYATVGGSDPRPTPGSMSVGSSVILTTILTVLGA